MKAGRGETRKQKCSRVIRERERESVDRRIQNARAVKRGSKSEQDIV